MFSLSLVFACSRWTFCSGVSSIARACSLLWSEDKKRLGPKTTTCPSTCQPLVLREVEPGATVVNARHDEFGKQALTGLLGLAAAPYPLLPDRKPQTPFRDVHATPQASQSRCSRGVILFRLFRRLAIGSPRGSQYEQPYSTGLTMPCCRAARRHGLSLTLFMVVGFCHLPHT